MPTPFPAPARPRHHAEELRPSAQEPEKGDWPKGLVAGLIRVRALVNKGWPSERLHMGAANAVARTIRHARERLPHDRKAQSIAPKSRKCVKVS
jgi:hypothetical protein